MCLGIPGQVVEVDTDHPDLALVDVSGAHRRVNLGLLSEDPVEVGDWVVIHMGFALEKISADQAADALDVLETIGPGAQPAETWQPPWA